MSPVVICPPWQPGRGVGQPRGAALTLWSLCSCPGLCPGLGEHCWAALPAGWGCLVHHSSGPASPGDPGSSSSHLEAASEPGQGILHGEHPARPSGCTQEQGPGAQRAGGAAALWRRGHLGLFPQLWVRHIFAAPTLIRHCWRQHVARGVFHRGHEGSFPHDLKEHLPAEEPGLLFSEKIPGLNTLACFYECFAASHLKSCLSAGPDKQNTLHKHPSPALQSQLGSLSLTACPLPVDSQPKQQRAAFSCGIYPFAACRFPACPSCLSSASPSTLCCWPGSARPPGCGTCSGWLRVSTAAPEAPELAPAPLGAVLV